MAKKRSKQKAIEITEGSVTVKIYHTPSRVAGKLYPSYTLCYTLHGQPIRKQSTKLPALIEEAKTAARRIANAQTAALTLSDAEVAEYTASKQKLSSIFDFRFSISLLSAVETSIETINILRGKTTPQEAARQWLERNKGITPITTANLVQQFLTAKEQEHCSKKHLYNLKNNLARWTAHFQCNIGDVTRADVQAWLRALAGGAQTKLHHLRAVTNLCNYAIVNGLLPKNWDELSNISVGLIAETTIGTYTPADLEKLLRGALGQIPLKEKVTWKSDTLSAAGGERRREVEHTHLITDTDRAAFKQNIPFIVTGAFAGLRTAERLRTHWSHFNWETNRIHVIGKRTKGKTTRSNSRRLVPIHPALRDWLEPFIPVAGTPAADAPIVPYGEHVALQRLRLLSLAVGVEPIENGLRHSYISYRCAELNGDKAKVADESGNSVSTINKHYLDLKTPTQAAAWFALRRELAQNITQLRKRA